MKNSIFQTIRVSSSPEAFSEEASMRLFNTLKEMSGIGEPVSIALSGGATPVPIYKNLGERLRRDPSFFTRIRWLQTDERFVPPDHPDSNGGMILRNLFSDFNDLSCFFRVNTLAESPEKAAIAYEKILRKNVCSREGQAKIRLLILGIGEDGHIASLFPEQEWQKSPERDFIEFQVGKLNSTRLSLSYTAILNSEKIIFLVSGKKKGMVLRKILGENPPRTPAGFLTAAKETEWWLDPPAASGITGLPVLNL